MGVSKCVITLLLCLQVFLEHAPALAYFQLSKSDSVHRVKSSTVKTFVGEKISKVPVNQVNRKSKLSLAAWYKQRPTRQKIKLYHSMVKTMAALELSRHKRLTKTSALYFFWQLFITEAYAQTQNEEVCFYGGHFLNGCNWRQATRDHSCEIDGTQGVSCNPAIFSTSPCVYTSLYARRQGISNYTTTQACAYADAQFVAQQLKDGRTFEDITQTVNPEQKKAIVANQLVDQELWNSPDPDEWSKKRDDLVKEILRDDDAMTRYNEFLLEKNLIFENLQDVEKICKFQVQNQLEKKHCTPFLKDLDALWELYLSPKGESSCFKFHKLPGEHFCQVSRSRSGNREYLVVRLEGGLDENKKVNPNVSLKAVVYKSTSRLGDYCPHPDFISHNRFANGLTNFSGRQNLHGEQRITCNADNSSYAASFQYPAIKGGNAYIQIEKEHGPSNLCRLKNCNDRSCSLVYGSSNYSDFLPVDISEKLQNAIKELKEKHKGEGDRKECIEASHVALYEAGLLFEAACQERSGGSGNDEFSLKIRSEDSVSRNSLWEWLNQSSQLTHTNQSDIALYKGVQYVQNLRLPSIIPAIRCRDFSSLSECPEANGTIPEGRRYRTITDYWFGDGYGPSISIYEPNQLVERREQVRNRARKSRERGRRGLATRGLEYDLIQYCTPPSVPARSGTRKSKGASGTR